MAKPSGDHAPPDGFVFRQTNAQRQGSSLFDHRDLSDRDPFGDGRMAIVHRLDRDAAVLVRPECRSGAVFAATSKKPLASLLFGFGLPAN